MERAKTGQRERTKNREKKRQEKTREDKTRQEKTRQDKRRQDKTRQEKGSKRPLCMYVCMYLTTCNYVHMYCIIPTYSYVTNYAN